MITRPGWLLGATLLGAVVGPAFYTSDTTHGPSIDRGMALHSLCGAALCLTGVAAVQLALIGFRYSLWRILEITTCVAVLAALLHRYLEAAERLREWL